MLLTHEEYGAHKSPTTITTRQAHKEIHDLPFYYKNTHHTKTSKTAEHKYVTPKKKPSLQDPHKQQSKYLKENNIVQKKHTNSLWKYRHYGDRPHNRGDINLCARPERVWRIRLSPSNLSNMVHHKQAIDLASNNKIRSKRQPGKPCQTITFNRAILLGSSIADLNSYNHYILKIFDPPNNRTSTCGNNHWIHIRQQRNPYRVHKIKG